jgi:pimeloyl-ACP methyl ester carboxylesterase
MAARPYRDIYFTTRDGLKLYGRHYPARVASSRRPVLCLPGLTRNSRDFERVAETLAGDQGTPRDVYTMDSRGRGNSEHARDWRDYVVPIEMHDVIDYMTMLELSDCGIIGTSRGGILSMVLAAAQPTRIGAVVLNDIGPVIETDGLIRIAGYVGRTPVPKSWPEAARLVRELMRRDFPQLSDSEAEVVARQLMNDRDGKPAAGYDAKIGRSFSVLDGPMPKLWAQFESLKRVPLLVIRGANSDLLTAATVDEMHKRHAMMASITVPGEGHAPLLRDEPTVRHIVTFFAEADTLRKYHAAAA